MASRIIEFLKRIAIRVFSSTVYGTCVGYAFAFSVCYMAINLLLLLVTGMTVVLDLIIFQTYEDGHITTAMWDLICSIMIFIAAFSSIIPMYIIERMKKPVYEAVNWGRDGF